MANKLISELTQVASVLAADEVEVQKSGETVTKKATVQQLLVPEATQRQATDDLLFDGTGIDDDGDITLNTNTWYLRDADLVTGITDRSGAVANLDKHIVNLCRVLDYRIYSLWQQMNAYNDLVAIEVTLTAPEILALNTVPKVLITCPADYCIDLLSVTARIIYNSTTYEAGSNKLSVQYEGGNTLFEFPNAFIETVDDAIYRGEITTNMELTPDEDVVLTCASNPTTGNSTMTVWLVYKLHSVGSPD